MHDAQLLCNPVTESPQLLIPEDELITITEKNNVQPLCPHCKAELSEVWIQPLSGMLGRRYIYFCPHCRSVLGVSHRKGFWMG